MSEGLKDNEVFERHRIVRKIGSGAMGDVYEAVQPTTDRAVALKIIIAERAQKRARELMVAEAKILARLNHKNIVQVLSADILDDGRVYIVMELLKGLPLRQHMAKRMPLHVAEALFIAIEVARALAYGHKQNVLHRDIKPENIFVTDDYEVKLLDYGVAKLGTMGMKSTRQGRRFGTPAYTAPELLTGGVIGPWSDVYALCIVLYEMLSGRHPFATGPGFHGMPQGAALCLAQELEPPKAIDTFLPAVAALKYVVDPLMKGLAKRPEDRFQEMSQLVLVLEGARNRYILESTSTSNQQGWRVTDMIPTVKSGPKLGSVTEPLPTQRATPVPGADVGGSKPPALAKTEPMAPAGPSASAIQLLPTEALPPKAIPRELCVGEPGDPRDEEARFVVQATLELVELGGKDEVRDVLVDALRKKPHPAVRAACAQALAMIGNAVTLATMRLQLSREPHPVVRANIEAAITAISKRIPSPTADAASLSVGTIPLPTQRAPTPVPHAATAQSPVATAGPPTLEAPTVPRPPDQAPPSSVAKTLKQTLPLSALPNPISARQAPAPTVMQTSVAMPASRPEKSRSLGKSLFVGAAIGIPMSIALAVGVKLSSRSHTPPEPSAAAVIDAGAAPPGSASSAPPNGTNGNQ